MAVSVWPGHAERRAGVARAAHADVQAEVAFDPTLRAAIDRRNIALHYNVVWVQTTPMAAAFSPLTAPACGRSPRPLPGRARGGRSQAHSPLRMTGTLAPSAQTPSMSTLSGADHPVDVDQRGIAALRLDLIGGRRGAIEETFRIALADAVGGTFSSNSVL